MSKLTFASRGSALALWQALHVRDRLLGQLPDCEIELLVIKTKGDKILDVPLAKVGGKALFVKEIEQALVDGVADIAVHSMKDVPTELEPGLTMAAVSAREDPRDAICTRGGAGLAELDEGARVGTSSLRRQCQLLARRPDLDIIALRGNVPTRLRKLDDGDYQAVVLAAAGLIRLGHGDRISAYLDPEECLPAVGQGVLGVEIREDAADTRALVRRAMHDEVTATCVAAERSFLARLGGGCQTPIAAHAHIDGDELALVGLVGEPDGSEILRAARRGHRDAAADLGRALAEELIGRGAAQVIDRCISTYGGPKAE